MRWVRGFIGYGRDGFVYICKLNERGLGVEEGFEVSS